MNHAHRTTLLAIAGILLSPQFVSAAFPGRPTLLSAEGGDRSAAWVAYENGDVLRCRADTGACQAMTGLPLFASPVSLSAEPDHAAAWVGWSDGTIYRCSSAGRCTAIYIPTDIGPGRGLR